MIVESGTPIIADVSGITDGDARPELHRYGGEQEPRTLSDGSYTGGLGRTRCGIDQASRGHGWFLLDAANSYQQENLCTGRWPVCPVCFPEGFSPTRDACAHAYAHA